MELQSSPNSIVVTATILGTPRDHVCNGPLIKTIFHHHVVLDLACPSPIPFSLIIDRKAVILGTLEAGLKVFLSLIVLDGRRSRYTLYYITRSQTYDLSFRRVFSPRLCNKPEY